MTKLSDFSVKTITGEDGALADYDGKVVLVVNTASFCGYTPQFAGLEKLYQENKDQGFAVLGFPCNQFAGQDPKSDAEIAAFSAEKYGVTFPMFQKVDVNGENAHPLYDWLKSEKRGILGSKRIKWNFTKFLIAADGTVVRRYSPRAKPEQIEADIKALLSQF